jgi:hypothetical protein
MPSKNNVRQYIVFPGFKIHYEKEFFMYPHVLEEYWCQMSGSEQKVLDFILRQTIGWRKTSDRISLEQFANGIGEKNKGTGLSYSQIQRAIKGLEKQGFIKVARTRHRPSTFQLVIEPNANLMNFEKTFDAFIRDNIR